MTTQRSLRISVYNPNERHTYVMDQVLRDWLQLDYTLCSSEDDDVMSIDVPEQNNAALTWPDSSILRAHGNLTDWTGSVVDMLTHLNSDAGEVESIDLFGLIFYLITSYDHYTCTEFDQHGRVPSSHSVLHKTGWLTHPIVDELLTWLGTALNDRFDITSSQAPYRLHSTIDIDHPWHTRHMKWPYRLKHYIKGRQRDPYDCYDELHELHEAAGLTPTYFLSPPADTRHDFINKYRLTLYEALIRRLDTQSRVGLHPSYATMTDDRLLLDEMSWLRSVLNHPVHQSRQHYLRTRWPHTFRHLIAAGTRHDYSLAFADHVGFSSGTARSYMWYDLGRESVTPLRIHPTIAMDVTLRQYMKCSPKEAHDLLQLMRTQIERHGGTFILLWHNSTLSDIDGWTTYAEVYRNFILSHATPSRP